MNLSALNNEELLRVAAPATDLERLLMARLTVAVDDVIDSEEMQCEGCECAECGGDGNIDQIEGLRQQLMALHVVRGNQFWAGLRGRVALDIGPIMSSMWCDDESDSAFPRLKEPSNVRSIFDAAAKK